MSGMNRRKFMGTAVGTAALAQIPSGQSAPPQGRSSVSIEALDAAAARPVLQLDGLPDPIIIESIELLRKKAEITLSACDPATVRKACRWITARASYLATDAEATGDFPTS